MISRWLRRLRLLVVLAVLLVPVYLLWFRDSSLVEVKDVRVIGVTGPDAVRVRSALTAAAQGMTTLHVDDRALARAAERFPIVKAIDIHSRFPNGLTVHVIQRRPVAVISAAGQHVAVAGDGVLLSGLTTSGLPALEVDHPPSRGRLSGDGLQAATILGAAPPPLRPLVQTATVVDGDVRLEMRNGPELRFGDGSDAGRKWAAAARLLSDPDVGSGGYVDVSSPSRAAVGGSVQETAPSTTPSTPAPPPAPTP